MEGAHHVDPFLRQVYMDDILNAITNPAIRNKAKEHVEKALTEIEARIHLTLKTATITHKEYQTRNWADGMIPLLGLGTKFAQNDYQLHNRKIKHKPANELLMPRQIDPIVKPFLIQTGENTEAYVERLVKYLGITKNSRSQNQSVAGSTENVTVGQFLLALEQHDPFLSKYIDMRLSKYLIEIKMPLIQKRFTDYTIQTSGQPNLHLLPVPCLLSHFKYDRNMAIRFENLKRDRSASPGQNENDDTDGFGSNDHLRDEAKLFNAVADEFNSTITWPKFKTKHKASCSDVFNLFNKSHHNTLFVANCLVTGNATLIQRLMPHSAEFLEPNTLPSFAIIFVYRSIKGTDEEMDQRRQRIGLNLRHRNIHGGNANFDYHARMNAEETLERLGYWATHTDHDFEDQYNESASVFTKWIQDTKALFSIDREQQTIHIVGAAHIIAAGKHRHMGIQSDGVDFWVTLQKDLWGKRFPRSEKKKKDKKQDDTIAADTTAISHGSDGTPREMRGRSPSPAISASITSSRRTDASESYVEEPVHGAYEEDSADDSTRLTHEYAPPHAHLRPRTIIRKGFRRSGMRRRDRPFYTLKDNAGRIEISSQPMARPPPPLPQHPQTQAAEGGLSNTTQTYDTDAFFKSMHAHMAPHVRAHGIPEDILSQVVGLLAAHVNAQSRGSQPGGEATPSPSESYVGDVHTHGRPQEHRNLMHMPLPLPAAADQRSHAEISEWSRRTGHSPVAKDTHGQSLGSLYNGTAFNAFHEFLNRHHAEFTQMAAEYMTALRKEAHQAEKSLRQLQSKLDDHRRLNHTSPQKIYAYQGFCHDIFSESNPVYANMLQALNITRDEKVLFDDFLSTMVILRFIEQNMPVYGHDGSVYTHNGAYRKPMPVSQPPQAHSVPKPTRPSEWHTGSSVHSQPRVLPVVPSAPKTNDAHAMRSVAAGDDSSVQSRDAGRMAQSHISHPESDFEHGNLDDTTALSDECHAFIHQKYDSLVHDAKEWLTNCSNDKHKIKQTNSTLHAQINRSIETNRWPQTFKSNVIECMIASLHHYYKTLLQQMEQEINEPIKSELFEYLTLLITSQFLENTIA